MNHKLIRCGDHSLAPWSIVCKHVVSGEAQEAIPLPKDDGEEVMFDWVCAECSALINEQGSEAYLDRLTCVCIHCVRDHILPLYKAEDETDEEAIRFRIEEEDESR
jgi:uncharacterized protein YrzB (UPF0473 family)